MTSVPVQGAVIARLLATPALMALVPSLSIMAGMMPEEARLPLVLVTDHEQDPLWIHDTCRYERHRITLDVHARVASPPLPDSPVPPVPAEAILDACEGAINWAEILTGDHVTLILVQRMGRQRETVKLRDDEAERVQKCSTSWQIEFEFNL